MPNFPVTPHSLPFLRKSLSVAVVALAAFEPEVAFAQAITVPNFSSETPDVTFAGSFDATPATPWQITQSSQQQVGAFDNQPPGSDDYIDNVTGSQVAYLFVGPGISLFQDLSGAGSTFAIGKSYTLTIGAGGAEQLPTDAQLQLRIFYRDGSNNKVTVALSSFAFDPALDPGEINHLYDYSVSTPVVLANDSWVGKNLGIEIATPGTPAFAYWDVDNVRLEAVPEPSSMLLVTTALTGLAMRRRRSASRL